MKLHQWITSGVCRFAALLILLAGLAGTVIIAADPPPAAPAGATVSLKGHSDTVYAITFTPDEKNVVTASFDKTLKIWESATGKDVKTLGGGPGGHQQMVLCLSVSADGALSAAGA